MPSGNIRFCGRADFRGPIRMHWLEAGDRQKSARGECIDISPTGIRVEAPVPIPVGSVVQFKLMDRKFSGHAVVRHCSRRDLKQIIGMHFVGGTKWHPKAVPASVA